MKDGFQNSFGDAMVAKLFVEVGPFYKDRPGGYVRILKAGFRTGDKAPMALVQLVDFESVEEVVTEAPKKEAKTAAPKKEAKTAAPKKEAKTATPKKEAKTKAAKKES